VVAHRANMTVLDSRTPLSYSMTASSSQIPDQSSAKQ
jgi:hypothetical protein